MLITPQTEQLPPAAGTAWARGQPVLSTNDLVVRYGAIEALHGISLRILENQIVCLIGANGAGKSSLLRCISGLIPAYRGEVLYRTHILKNGRQHKGWRTEAISRWPAHAVVRAGLSHVPEGRGIFPQMTVQENLDLGAYLRRDAEIASDRDRVFSLFPRIKERRTQLAGTMSGGEQQMLAIARALMSRPHMLLLDEPSLGLAPLLVEQIFTVVQEINRRGVTVLLVEQNAHMALQISHYAYVLETGTIALQGPAGEIRGNDQVRKAYLGED
jgi:branched-chain amino acid transport system ATP-binding protein